MPQAVWTGDLSFGLVSIPVKLYSATAPKRVQFHHYEAGTGRKIRYARVATGRAPAADEVDEPEPEIGGLEETDSRASVDASEPSIPSRPRSGESTAGEETLTEVGSHRSHFDEETEIPWEGVIRGYEIEPGRLVTVTPEEVASVAPERSRRLEVEEFTDLAGIDPVYFDKSYYVVPATARNAERPYWLLYRAMETAGRVAIGRFVMRTKEYLAAIRPAGHILMLQTLFYADEVRDPKELWHPLIAEPQERELKAARGLIEALAGAWEPARHRDEHRERLLKLLRGKAPTGSLAPPEPERDAATAPAIDLMDALRRSIEVAKQG
ncbi:MAG TPA: Ku protein [Actinomycetota bacterium]|nr:Ku protein [Actinomycetota bacterium]